VLVTGALAPLLLLAIVVATDLWVFVDARRCADVGTPVFFRIGTFRIETPVMWVVACFVVWIIFFPLYLVGRSQS
jgi:hypothetical protein